MRDGHLALGGGVQTLPEDRIVASLVDSRGNDWVHRPTMAPTSTWISSFGSR